jgi:hypothetical protein
LVAAIRGVLVKNGLRMRMGMRRGLWLGGLLVAAIAGVSPCPRRPSGITEGNADFAPIGLHPGARDQPTEMGRTLATLTAWEGRIYAGYGDIYANTGPIAIMPYDPRTASFVPEWVSDTEAVHTYRAIGSELWAPATDPRVKADVAIGKPWRDELPVHATHVYDAATLTGTDRWLVGSQDYDALAWRSAGPGAPWVESLRIPAVDDGKRDFARFYFAGVLDGRLYVQSCDYHRGRRPTSKVWDGAWSDGPSLLPAAGDLGWHPVLFADRMVYVTTQSIFAGGSRLLSFDGRQVSRVSPDSVWSFTVDRGRLFTLGMKGEVRRTSDLVSWTTVARAPEGGRSLALLKGSIYVGAAGAGLYRSRRADY